MKYSIVIPTHNGASTLPSLLEKLSAFFNVRNETFEIIIVDDKSIDDTWKVISQLKNQNSNIKAYRLSRNYGQHNATLCGIIQSTGERIITMDDDLQHMPDEITKLIEEKDRSGNDVVYAIYPHNKHSVIRRFISWLYKQASRLDTESKAQGSSFRIIDGSFREKFKNHPFHFIFIDEICLWYTEHISYVPVIHYKSQKDKSGYNISKLVKISRRLMMYSSDIHLRAMIYVGFLVAFINGLIGLRFLIRKMFFKVPLGYTSIIVSVLFSTGLILVCLGVIGYYLGQVYKISNRHPAYNIREQV